MQMPFDTHIGCATMLSRKCHDRRADSGWDVQASQEAPASREQQVSQVMHKAASRR